MRSRTKKYKRLISVLCSILLACNVSSCGYGESDIEVITIWSSSMSSKMILEKIVDGFNRTVGKTNGIFIDYHTKDPLTFGEEITKAFESGNPPDMFAGFSRDYAQKGYVVPISEIDGGQEFLNEFKDIPARTDNSFDGKIYCTPISVTTHGLLYNKEMFKKAGLTDDAGNPAPPETFEQLREYAKQLTDFDKNEYGIVLPLKWSGWYGSDIRSSMMSSCGYQEFNPVTGKFDYTGAVPIMQTYLDIMNDKSCVPGAEQIDNDTARALFASGGVGMKLAFSFDVNVINDQYPASIDWGVAPLPVVDKDNKYKQRMAYGYSFCVTSRAAEKTDGSKLIRILKYFNSKEIQKELYISSAAIPYDSSVIGVKTDKKLKNGWSEFCSFADISAVYPDVPQYNINSSDRIDSYFMQNVITGKVTPEECARHVGEVVNSAVEEYYRKLPDEEFNMFIIPDWDIKR